MSLGVITVLRHREMDPPRRARAPAYQSLHHRWATWKVTRHTIEVCQLVSLGANPKFGPPLGYLKGDPTLRCISW